MESDSKRFVCDNSLIVKDALQIYFSKYHFKDGGYNLKWFKIKLGNFFIPFPNIKDRVDAVKFHDIHHLITEYNADYRGEAEIGGWEIASGCGKYYMAWILNLGSFIIGMFLYPRSLFNAFMRGRACATNLYYSVSYDDELLNKSLGELRDIIQIDVKKKSSAKDYLIFIFYCLIALLYHLSILLIFIFIIYSLVKLIL